MIEPRNALFVRADVVRWTEGHLAGSQRPWTQHLASDGAKPQVLGWYRRAKATKRGGMDGEESACLRVPPKRGN